MGRAIGEMVPAAVVIAVGPLQIIGVILLLFSRRASVNSLAFLGGWLVGLAVVSAIALSIEQPVIESSNGNAASFGAILQLAIGLALVVLAVRQWRTRPRQGEPAKLPGWIAAIDSVGPARALGVGFLLSGPNLKVVLLTLAAMLTVVQAELSGTQAVVAIAVYIIVASSSVIAPVLCNLLLGKRATPSLQTLREWLEGNYSSIMVALFLIIGVVVGGKGLGTLIG